VQEFRTLFIFYWRTVSYLAPGWTCVALSIRQHPVSFMRGLVCCRPPGHKASRQPNLCWALLCSSFWSPVCSFDLSCPRLPPACYSSRIANQVLLRPPTCSGPNSVINHKVDCLRVPWKAAPFRPSLGVLASPAPRRALLSLRRNH